MSMSRCTYVAQPRSQSLLEPETIHTLPGLAVGKTVLFASTPLAHEARPGLILRLLQALETLGLLWRSPTVENAFTLHKTPRGKPYLLIGNRQGPSLSFSHGDRRLWAAVGSQGAVGIDVADPVEFAGAYPLERAFRPQELDSVQALTQKKSARAAALIWSLKEASVKAAGTGFNTYDPLEVRVGSPRISDCGILFDVWAGRSISAWARAEGRGWLAVASISHI